MADVNTDFYPQAQQGNLLTMMGGAQNLANAAQQNQLLRTANQQTHQDLVKSQVNYLASGLGALALKPDLSQADLMGFGDRALAEGIINPQTHAVESQQVLAAGNDPVKLRALANQYQARALSAGEQYAAQHGYVAGAGGNQVQVPAVDSNGNPTGATQSITQSQFSDPGNPLVSKGGGGNSLTGSSPANPTNSPAPTSGVPAPSATAPVPLAPQKPFVTATPQQIDQFKASAAQQQDDLSADANYTANIVPLSKVINLLPKTPLFGSGAQMPTEVAKVLNTFGVKIGSDQATNSSELEKYLTQMARSSGAAPNTNDQLAAALTANPSMTSDKSAAQDVVKTMMALARMKHTMVAQAQSAGIPPEGYSKFASTWGAQQDPRAYAFDLMTPEAKAALKTELKANPQEAAKFIGSYNTAFPPAASGQ